MFAFIALIVVILCATLALGYMSIKRTHRYLAHDSLSRDLYDHDTRGMRSYSAKH
jgi:hypothetical protein